MNIVALIKETPDKTWRISVPDLPGVATTAPTRAAAVRQAAVDVAAAVRLLRASSRPIPLPRTLQQLESDNSFRNAVATGSQVELVYINA